MSMAAGEYVSVSSQSDTEQADLARETGELADNPQFVQMFLSEAKLAAQLNHPNIVQVFDFGQAGR